MRASIIPASPASASSSLSSLSVTLAASPSAADSAHNQPHGKKDKDECICQAAYDFPSNASQGAQPHIEAISPLTNAILSKSFSTCNSPKTLTAGLDCVQCVESFPDSMNHCVPEWDAATGKEMDIIWEQTDLFSPSKGKWDLGHTRKSDLGFVPELDFEELCWEDGQLLVVMQGLHCRGTTKNQSTDETTLTSVSPTINTFNVPRSAELVDPSSVNIHTQEDELLSWLQHPPEDVGDRLEIPSDSLVLSTSLADRERVLASDPTPRGFRRNLGLSEDFGNGPVPKFTKPPNTLATYSSILGNKTVHESINQQTGSAAGPAFIPSASLRNKEQCEPCLPLTAEAEMPPSLQTHSASVSMPYGTSLPKASTRAMNFSNFSRPAVAIKANLKSLGIANGPSGAERLKQLDRVAADIYKAESVYSSTKHPKLIAPRRGGVPLHAVPRLSQSVGASLIRDPEHNFPLEKETKQSVSASEPSLVRRPEQDLCAQGGFSITGALNRSPEMRVESNGLFSTTILGMDASTEVLDVPEPSELSSGGSENSDFDGEKASGNLKRKFNDEDSKFQSEALENEVTGDKQQAGANGNDLKRSKTTESHNQSERRRRDRISEKMKALQALVPNSHKIDKASMLEEAIAYIKALKFQIQMMSYRGGMHFSPMVLPVGVQQHVQMASWPLMNVGIGMHMGMGMNAGIGIHDMNMVMGIAAPRPFSPMMTFPSALVPGAQTTASATLNTAHIRHGFAGHVVPLPAGHLMVPLRPGIPIFGDSDSTLVAKDASPQSCPTSQ